MIPKIRKWPFGFGFNRIVDENALGLRILFRPYRSVSVVDDVDVIGVVDVAGVATATSRTDARQNLLSTQNHNLLEQKIFLHLTGFEDFVEISDAIKFFSAKVLEKRPKNENEQII